MSNANGAAPAPSASVGGVLLVCKDAVTIKQLSGSLQQLALSPEVCNDGSAALALLNQNKFDAVVVDLQLGAQANAILERIRLSAWNRTAVLFTITDTDAETASAFKAGSSFVLKRPLSLAAIDRSLKVAYGLIVRERRRYFRCPLEIPAKLCGSAIPVIHGQTVNISEGGIAVAASSALDPEIKVQVQFTLPGHKTPFAADAVVCWSKGTSFGLQFTSLSPDLDSELQEWLSRRLEQSLPQSVTDQFRKVKPSDA
jgi:two-component system, chemotaxis family, chemotaxis protein CheY